MTFSYAAWGLHLSASFELPADPPRHAARAPDVELRLVAAADQAREWSGGTTLWEGELGDGESLRLERAADRSHRLRYGEQASFLIDAEAKRVSCAVREPAAAGWQRVLLDAVLATVAVLRGSEALHGSAVEAADGVVAIVALSGSGKSTLAAELLERGSALFSDDLLVVSRTPDGPRVSPAPPVMSLPSGLLADGRPAWARAILDEAESETWVLAPSAGPGERELAAICFLSWSTQPSTRLVPIAGSPLDLLPHLMTLDLGADRAASRFELLSDLVEGTRCYRLEAAHDATPTQLAELVEQAPAGLEVLR